MTYNLTIKQNAAEDWIVKPDGEPSTVKPGDTIVWSLDAPPETSAHLQFCDDIFEASGVLDEHWVTKIEHGDVLELTVSAKALPDPRVRRRSYSYAVMVVDNNGVRYAFGSNPPPDLDVGD